MQRLDSFSKILLATQTINYMASALNGVTQQMAFSKSEFLKEAVEANTKKLSDTVDNLKVILEDVGNYLNAIDATCPLDERATEAAFDILVHGKDDCEE